MYIFQHRDFISLERTQERPKGLAQRPAARREGVSLSVQHLRCLLSKLYNHEILCVESHANSLKFNLI